MKFLISCLLVVLLTGCSGIPEGNPPIFRALDQSEFAVSGAYEEGAGVLWIIDSSDDLDPPVLRLSGPWDLTQYTHIEVKLVGGNAYGNIDVNLKMEGDGSFQAKKRLRAKDTMEWIIPLPLSPVDPEISNNLKGMRATPFSIEGVTSDLDYSKVDKILVSFDKGLKGTKLGIVEIAGVHRVPVPQPKWFGMAEDEFYPFIDQYGQFIHKDWPGKTMKDEDLLAAHRKEMDFMENNPGPNDRSKYGGWINGGLQKATGHFYLDKINGKWWMVDPEGHLFWSHGVVRVTSSSAVTIIDGREYYFASLPDTHNPLGKFYETRDEFMYKYYKSWGIERTFDYSSANIYRKYGENWRESYRDMIRARLLNWGMNTISAGSDPDIYHGMNVPYSDRIELNSPRIAGAPKHLNVIRDPFHTAFDQGLEDQLLEREEELESTWCYGYFIDNKLVWGEAPDLGRWVLKSPADQPAKQAFALHLKNKYKTITELNKVWNTAYSDWEELLAEQNKIPQTALGDCEDFSTVLIEEYFKKVDRTLERIAPDKLNLGCRYVTFNERVLRIAAKYSDVLTFDLFWDSLSEFRLPEGIDKPVLIGEFHFGATDRGLFHPGLNQKANQEERGMAYEKYVRSALLNPFVVGTAWHQFSDQATTGRFDGENFQDGLTDVADRVYWETILKVKEIGSDLYRIRRGQERLPRGQDNTDSYQENN